MMRVFFGIVSLGCFGFGSVCAATAIYGLDKDWLMALCVFGFAAAIFFWLAAFSAKEAWRDSA